MVIEPTVAAGENDTAKADNDQRKAGPASCALHAAFPLPKQSVLEGG
jgi:hypothetical protein